MKTYWLRLSHNPKINSDIFHTSQVPCEAATAASPRQEPSSLTLKSRHDCLCAKGRQCLSLPRPSAIQTSLKTETGKTVSRKHRHDKTRDCPEESSVSSSYIKLFLHRTQPTHIIWIIYNIPILTRLLFGSKISVPQFLLTGASLACLTPAHSWISA